ncbi:transposase domain-containing protein [Streptomyces sp. NPDC051976]|uniref:transposase domain-containing protein n=1 Tax=Streptomyces sp. NPDC051976 TaxID=3154947 RepID=UPI0034190507
MHPWTGYPMMSGSGVPTEWFPPESVDEVLAEYGRQDKHPDALTARLMVCYVLASALFQQHSYDDVAERLVGALGSMDEAILNKSSITLARQRLDAAPLEAVFHRQAGTVAPPGLARSSYRGMRLAAVDGMVFDASDTAANRAVFGGLLGCKRQAVWIPDGQGGDLGGDRDACLDRRGPGRVQRRGRSIFIDVRPDFRALFVCA